MKNYSIKITALLFFSFQQGYNCIFAQKNDLQCQNKSAIKYR
jgi:hypothetical protein